MSAGGVRQAVHGRGSTRRSARPWTDFDEWRKALKELAQLRQGRQERRGDLQKARRSSRHVSRTTSKPATPTNFSPRPISPRTTRRRPSRASEVRRRSAGAIRKRSRSWRPLEEEPGKSEGSRGDARSDQLHLSRSTRTCTATWATCGSTQKNYAGAIREYSAVVAMQPARPGRRAVQSGAGLFRRGPEGQGRRTHILPSLEAAPDFRPAQKLLLQLKDSEKGK